MSIFEAIAKSIYSPSYYAKIRGEKLRTSFSYFISLAIVVSLIATAVITVRILPVAKTVLSNFALEIMKRFPEGLVLTIKDNQVSTNSEESVSIPFSLGSSTPGLPTNFLVIDTKTSFDESHFRNASTVLYLTKDTIYVADEDGGIKQSEKLEVPDVTIDRALVLEWLQNLTPLLAWLPFILVFAIFFTSLWLVMLALIELVITALFIMLLSKVRGEKLSYRESYKIGLHAVTARLLFSVSAVLGPAPLAALIFMPFFGVITTLIIYWINSDSEVNKVNETPVQ